MGGVILVTSCKGGVGKSTVAANVSLFLALSGCRTLLIDCDLSMRCLDLILGLENSVVYDLYDVMVRDIPFEKAIMKFEREPNLSFCAAPFKYLPSDKFTPERFKEFVLAIKESGSYEYIIIDTAAGIGESLEIASFAADTALIVATHNPASIRAAERTGEYLNNNRNTILYKRLVVNCFETGILPDIIEIIDRSYLQLIGVVPYSKKLAEVQYAGQLADKSDFNTVKAFENIAARVRGENVPLMRGFKQYKKTRKKIVNVTRKD